MKWKRQIKKLEKVIAPHMIEIPQFRALIDGKEEIMSALDYIEQTYRTATLTELCDRMHLPMHVMSRMVKKSTGYNFKELLQRKRLNKAVELICDTDLPINDIITAVGYENNSYFHRVFKERYQMTPKRFREKSRVKEQIRL